MPPTTTRGFLHVDFEPELYEVAQDFARVEAALENKSEVLAIAAGVASSEIDRMFEREEDAFGDDWQYWKETPPPGGKPSQAYARRAERLPNVGILNRRNRPQGLRRTATSSATFVITGNTLAYGAGLPRWAGVHLHGGDRVFADGYKIPQRSFYPYSPEGVALVKSVFDEWADAAVIIMKRKSTRGKKYTQIQRRTPTGQFGTKPF